MVEFAGGPLVAGLPMYDWPEVKWATDALWSNLAERLRAAGLAAPDRLDRTLAPDDLWRHPRLLFGQTCGYPYATALRDAVTYVATPGYGADGCAGTAYSSMIVVRADEPAQDLTAMGGRNAAVNGMSSLSGCLALRLAIAAHGPAAMPAQVRLSGSHRNSLRMVAARDADVCAVDAVCWALAQSHEAALVSELRVLARTPPAPALPFICSAASMPRQRDQIRAALAEALADPALDEVRAALLLTGVLTVDEAAYDRVLVLEQIAAAVALPEQDQGSIEAGFGSSRSHRLP